MWYNVILKKVLRLSYWFVFQLTKYIVFICPDFIQVESCRNCFPERVPRRDDSFGKGFEHPAVWNQHAHGVAPASDLPTTSKAQQSANLRQDMSATHQSHSGWCLKTIWSDDGGSWADYCCHPPPEIQDQLDWEGRYHWSRYDFIFWRYAVITCVSTQFVDILISVKGPGPFRHLEAACCYILILILQLTENIHTKEINSYNMEICTNKNQTELKEFTKRFFIWNEV